MQFQSHFIGETALASSLTPDETTSHSTRLSAEELLAGHPKDDSQVAGYSRATATRYWRSQPIAGAVAWPFLPHRRATPHRVGTALALPASFALRSGRCKASDNRTAYPLRVRRRPFGWAQDRLV